MKKIISLILVAVLTLSLFSACSDNSSGNIQADNQSNFNTSKSISVISREDGSGTRGAFIELFGVEVKGDDGTKKDMTTDEAIFINKTDVMLTSVANDTYSIGYVSMGSLNTTVKAVDIEGVKASTDNVKNGTYVVSRPFNIAVNGDPTGLTKDFLDYVLSKEGQEIIAKSYIAVDENAPAYSGSKPEGKIVIAGSSSVTPIMEKLKEAYVELNPNAKIEIQMSDSTAGIQAAIEGTCQIGMASRALKDSEKEKLTEIKIAIDGIAVIVNNSNPVENLTKDQVKSVYTGETTKWSDLIK